MKIDQEILESCIKEDRKATEQLYKYCFQALMPVCFRFYKNEEDARGALNIGFMKIIGALKDLNLSEVNFNAWSKRVMNNALIDEYRKSKKYHDRYAITEKESTLDFFADSDENQALSNFGESSILKLIKLLPDTTSQVFNLFVIDGYAHKEIAEMLEIPEGTSKWHLSQAKKILRENLEKLESNTKRMVI